MVAAKRAVGEAFLHNRVTREYEAGLVKDSEALLKRSHLNLATCVPRYP